MQDVTLIFPHQLFKDHPSLNSGRLVIIIEEWLFFNQYPFHKQKLVLHRASMRWYAQHLKQQGYAVEYVEAADGKNDIKNCIEWLAGKQCRRIFFADPTDNWLLNRISTACKKYALEICMDATPMFLDTMEEGNAYFNHRKTYFQTDFYIHQRKRKNILINSDGTPAGDKWTFDAENRLRFPRKQPVPPAPPSVDNEFLQEAREYVQRYFPTNNGNAEPPHFFVTSHNKAFEWLQDFIANRFEKFGDYEDAIVAAEPVLHHALLSPMLNTGLLTPQQVLREVLGKAKLFGIPLNSLEGFVRQVIGWREFIRIIYEREGSRQRTCNYWEFTRPIPSSFWQGTTGIDPVDLTIKKLLKNGYNHHIERLMVMGNFMLLCEFDPGEVYRWFMEMYVDAYDWVMVPNVYGMTQFADGGLMTTKPYISGSHYLLKMSDYPKGKWQDTWDALFWRFMHVHRYFFEKNPRLSMLLKTFDKWPAAKRNALLDIAENFLLGLGE